MKYVGEREQNCRFQESMLIPKIREYTCAYSPKERVYTLDSLSINHKLNYMLSLERRISLFYNKHEKLQLLMYM